jgi:uncharacterized protein YkwD
MSDRKRMLWAFLGLVIILSGCNFPLTVIPPDTTTFAQRGASRLTPVGNISEVPVELHQTLTALPPGLNVLATMTAVEAARIAEGGAGNSTPEATPPPTQTSLPIHIPTNTQPPSQNHQPSVPTNTSWIVPSSTFTSVPPQPPAATNTIPPPPTNTNTPNPSPTSTKTATKQSTHTYTPATCNPSGNSAYESQLIALINQERADEGLPPLSGQSQLTSAARIHSADMACNGFFSHISPTTGSPFDRIAAQGYSFSAAGENIAAGYSSAASTVETWMNSAGHRANILSANYVHIGIGYAYWEDSTYGAYWTAVFASP